MASNKVPKDYPRDLQIAVQAGMADELHYGDHFSDKFAGGMTEEDLYARYISALSISEHLAKHCIEYSKETDWSRERILLAVENMLDKEAVSKDWDIAESEHQWIMKKTKEILGWQFDA